METTQTAVEYLLEKLYNEYRFSFSGTIVEQAKQIEKEQIMNAYNKGNMESEIANLYAEKFYKETYNK